jgi:hypothetical protein
MLQSMINAPWALNANLAAYSELVRVPDPGIGLEQRSPTDALA